MTAVPSLSSLRKPIVLLAATVGLVALGVSVARVPGAADDARQQLDVAKIAIQAGDEAAAQAAVERARDHVDTVQVGLQGPVGLVGQWIPVVGTSIRDGRHLGDALDAVTAVAEIGAESYPEITGDDSTFFTDNQVDLPTLERLVDHAAEAQKELSRATTSLAEIDGTGPGGSRLGTARDQALAQVQPLHDGLTDALPMLEELPDILGAEGERKYLVAILNPAEQRYSGGTPLAFAPVSVRDGALEFGEAVDTNQSFMFRELYWKKVQGNPFHRGRQRVTAANFAPSWPVAGEETLNAWRALRGRNGSGLVAIDVVALAALAKVTGPMDVPGIGSVDSTNLVETLVGSYERFPSNEERRTANRALIDLFRDRLFAPGQLKEKITALGKAADGRHFAVYFRDDDVQAAFAGLGLTGDLSATEHDYIGTFSQNVVPSKSDYWQRRTVTSTVALRADGSARVRQVVDIHNDTTPYPLPDVDPRQGYITRWLQTSVAAFLPKGADVHSASALGEPFDFTVGDYFGRPFVRRTIVLPPQARGRVVLDYDVPAAAVVGDDGALTYKLDVDPHGLVIPEALDVTVTWPKGHRLSDLPSGWKKLDAHTAQWRDAGLVTSPRFAITAAP
ncbi:hypothetical protein CF8_3326 [Nocardioides sp. CF8]|nr:hypothetical protein CF8_3326 [Nocardioides sp. CF8]